MLLVQGLAVNAMVWPRLATWQCRLCSYVAMQLVWLGGVRSLGALLCDFFEGYLPQCLVCTPSCGDDSMCL